VLGAEAYRGFSVTRFDDEQSLLTIIPGGFVRILPDRDYFERSSAEGQNDKSHGNSARFCPTIQLAHHSVKDYLLSSRVSRQEFQTDSILAHKVLKETCAAYLLSVTQAFAQSRADPFNEFPLLNYVSTYWPYHLSEAEHHDQVLARHLAVAFAQGSFELILTEAGFREDERDFLLANELRVICSKSAPCGQCMELALRRNQALVPYFNVSGTSQLQLLATFVVLHIKILPFTLLNAR
jgi:hypothetical protein